MNLLDKFAESMEGAQAEVFELVSNRLSEVDVSFETLTSLEAIGSMGEAEKPAGNMAMQQEKQQPSQEPPYENLVPKAASVIELAATQETDQEAMLREARELISGIDGLDDDLELAA
ncbi:hypothetical protein A3D14_00975 [Candidatus Saccharibacteria bacterium RIFCSPHIGHO2_02_FULL_47_12]|nr:MAG: hypothetical protein A3D14_00975 [Candidatus Saccharibacteria bacterium RIFCSPHIGHO2_02_FULL_47_12]